MTEPSSSRQWLTILRASAALVVVLILSPLAVGRTDLLGFQGGSLLDESGTIRATSEKRPAEGGP